MKKITISIFALLLGLGLQAQSVDDILNNYFENTGGLEKWQALETVEMSGKAPSPQGEFPFMVYNKRPNKMKIEVNIQGKTLIPQAYDGEIAWGLNPFAGGASAQKIPDEMVWTIADQAEFEPVYINYQDKGHAITLDGEETIDGAETYRLKVVKNQNNDKQEITEYHFFDKENFVPIMIRSSVLEGPGKGTETESYMSDYQETEYGIMMPYYLETRANGEVGQKIVLERVKINGGIDDSIFAYPEPAAEDEILEEEEVLEEEEAPEMEDESETEDDGN